MTMRLMQIITNELFLQDPIVTLAAKKVLKNILCYKNTTQKIMIILMTVVK